MSMQKKVMDEFQIHFQRLAAKFPPVLTRDKRHREIPWMEYIKDLTEEEEECV
jgi:hypothetical protein